METKLETLVAEVVTEHGSSLYDCEFEGNTLHVWVTGASIDDIADLSRSLSRRLDNDDPIAGSYQLEVSSPGLERRLRRPSHFAEAIGEAVTVKLRAGAAEPRRFRGTLATATEDAGTVETDEGDRIDFEFANVERALTVFTWGATPKPSPSRGRPAAAGTSHHPTQGGRK